jgi:nucleoside-diphosphate-sugar epimerase
MNILVTGAAGFIGSHLCERLLADGHAVRGVDCFVPYYPRAIKEGNLYGLRGRPGFSFINADLRTEPIEPLLSEVDVVFHLAAMAGLPRSWTEFDLYETCNVVAAQRLAAVASRCPDLKRFVYVSTSSVYGRYASGDESLPTRPISPYGVTKLAAESLCRAYADEFGLPLVTLRYFSVYGPRQRPDMGYHKFVRAMLLGEPIEVYGDGQQVRGNTYIDDCVAATVAAMRAPAGETYNVGGGETASVWDILHRLEEIVGRPARVVNKAARPGDQRHTTADTAKLARHLGWKPMVDLATGLRRQVDWQRGQLSVAARAA